MAADGTLLLLQRTHIGLVDEAKRHLAAAGTVAALPISGCNAVVLAAGESDSFGIATDGTNVHWTCSDGTIRTAPAPAH